MTNLSGPQKILIIRFSSFGDVVQSLSIPSQLKTKFPDAQIHWVTRSEFAPLLAQHPAIHQVWVLDRKLGVLGLIRLALKLREQHFTHIYDAHNNLRSRLICWLMSPKLNFIRRKLFRFRRFLLFRFRINKFEMPFSGQRDLLKPLEAWGIPFALPPAPQLFLSDQPSENAQSILQSLPQDYIALAPSAAHALKRWPIEYWIELVQSMPQKYFVILGGPEDQFTQAIADVAPERIINLCGKMSLLESSHLVKRAKLLICNDTGLLHVAEQLGRPAVALMGPAPFGFPSRPSTKIMEINLPCRPCSKHGQGPCINAEFHKCLRDIKPQQVQSAAELFLKTTEALQP